MEVKRIVLSAFRKKRVMLFLIVFFLVLLFYDEKWLGKWMYPVKYEEDILLSANHHNVDPFLLAAIIRVESNFRGDLISEKGAVGLMQIMPETAKWIVRAAGYSEWTLHNLDREEVNIEVGAWYIKALHNEFGGNRVAVIAAYNAGPGNVKKWLHNRIWDGREETVHQIPFGETRHYVKRVLYYYNKYRKVYADSW